MFDKSLIESGKGPQGAGGWKGTIVSLVLHALLLGGVVAAGVYVKENPEVIEKPIEAFVVANTAPPPPPPPPPPAASTTKPKTTPTPTVRRETFTAPTTTPTEVPIPESSGDAEDEPVEGGVEGGVVGGVIGGVIGGVVGGVIGGTVGGTGTTDMPVRVGGDVKAPTVVSRVDPMYPEIARKARIQGIVIIEAIIDREGNVTDARVLKGLPMGLDKSALDAVMKWKFKPGVLNGKPVPVIFSLTVNFQIS